MLKNVSVLFVAFFTMHILLIMSLQISNHVNETSIWSDKYQPPTLEEIQLAEDRCIQYTYVAGEIFQEKKCMKKY
jgi:hypothetical protein